MRPLALFIDRLDQAAHYGMQRSLTRIGTEVVTHLKKEIAKPKAGVKYSNLPNPSSTPGEYPAYQFGNLSRGLSYRKYVAERSKIEFLSREPYGDFLKNKDRKWYEDILRDKFRYYGHIIAEDSGFE